jgi:hypothetical protein
MAITLCKDRLTCPAGQRPPGDCVLGQERLVLSIKVSCSGNLTQEEGEGWQAVWGPRVRHKWIKTHCLL